MENTIENQVAEKELSWPGPAGGITRESGRLLAALQQQALRVAHWKSNAHLQEALAGKTDLDLLVHPADRRAFTGLLRTLGYLQLQSQPWGSYPDVEDYLGLDHDTGQFLHIHAHYALVTGIRHVKHLYLPWVEAFFAHVQTDAQTGWPVPRPELEALILFIRIWAKTPPETRLKQNPEVPAYIRQELLGLLARADDSVMRRIGQQLGLQLPADLAQQLQAIQKATDDRGLLRLAQDLYAQVKPHYRTPWTRALLQSYAYRLLLKVIPYAVRFTGPLRRGKRVVGGGSIIAFIGSDGSGKSTLSQDILRWLTYKIDTHYFYLGKEPFIRSYQKRIWALDEAIFRPSRAGRFFRKLLGRYYQVLLIRKKVGLLELAHKMRRRGSVILCDRFPQHQVAGINDGPHLSAWAGSPVAHLEQAYFDQAAGLAADLVFRLQVSPETAIRRKPEHDFEQIKIKSAALDQITFPMGHTIPIDANQPYDQVLLAIKRAIWSHMQQR
ncbi:MAG: hypothetical protein ACO1O1_00950 [Adhaeribacter sp.]